jgi:hypothetical protein
MQTKICKRCEVEKPLTDFYTARGKAMNPCKACRSSKAYKHNSGLKNFNPYPLASRRR